MNLGGGRGAHSGIALLPVLSRAIQSGYPGLPEAQMIIQMDGWEMDAAL